jgi:DNA-binding MarR family transcriptional regulator
LSKGAVGNGKESREDIFAREVSALLYKLCGNVGACDEACVSGCGVTASQGYTLLALPEQGGLTMNELSSAMGLANSTMTRMLDNLVGKKLASREHDESDRRIVRVGLTAEGRKVRRAFSEGKRQVVKAVLAQIGGGEQEAILEALRTLSAAVEAVMEQCESGCST